METVTSESDTLVQAKAAVSRGEWDEALELLDTVGADEPEAEALETLAIAAYGRGELERAVSAWEDLHSLHVGTGHDVAAARAATMVALYLMMDTGLMSPVRGWLGRAERLLPNHDTPVHAMTAMVRAYERFMCGDMDAAARWAHIAVDVGTRHRVAPAVALGRVAAARVRILAGHVDESLDALDEVAVMLVSGELDALTTGMVWCELICAMQGLALYDRAEEWTNAMERWRHGAAVGGINGRCRVHRAEILRLRGSCEEAEEEALRACEELRPWMRREFGWPLTELGTIRLRRGDLNGAHAAFVAAHGSAWDPHPGLALVALARGNVDEATEMIANALAHPMQIPSKERPPFGELRRAPLLDAQVEIAVAAGDAATARRAAGHLSTIAATFASPALAACAALARGRAALADGDVDSSIRECEEAVAGWVTIGAPFEAAVARTVLADAHSIGRNDASARLERRAARTVFERLGARRWDAAPPQPIDDRRTHRSPQANVFRCEGDTRTITFEGETILLRDLKGLRYLQRLLAEPGREFHTLDLVAVEEGVLPTGPSPSPERLSRVDGGDSGLLLDDEARAAYRRRLAEIDEDIEEASAMNDPERVELARADREYLVAELSRAVGLGGRARRGGSTSERARSSVTRTLRYALTRIAEHHPTLASHLEHTVHTGTYCRYTPDPTSPVTWKV